MRVVASGPITRYGAIAAVTVTASRGTERLARCIIDQGSGSTYVVADWLQRIGAHRTGLVDYTDTVAGTVKSEEYRLSLTIGEMRLPNLSVWSLESIPDRMQALIGRNVIDTCEMLYGGRYTWKWELRQPQGTIV